jgi:hypothetical protein
MRVQPPHDGETPRAILIFEGPPGTGKTELISHLMEEHDTRFAAEPWGEDRPIWPLVGFPLEVEGAPPSMLSRTHNGVVGVEHIDKIAPQDLETLGTHIGVAEDAAGEHMDLGWATLAGTAENNADDVAKRLAESADTPVTVIRTEPLSQDAVGSLIDQKLEHLGVLAERKEAYLEVAPGVREKLLEKYAETGGDRGAHHLDDIFRSVQRAAGQQIADGSTRIVIEPGHVT